MQIQTPGISTSQPPSPEGAVAGSHSCLNTSNKAAFMGWNASVPEHQPDGASCAFGEQCPSPGRQCTGLDVDTTIKQPLPYDTFLQAMAKSTELGAEDLFNMLLHLSCMPAFKAAEAAMTADDSDDSDDESSKVEAVLQAFWANRIPTVGEMLDLLDKNDYEEIADALLEIYQLPDPCPPEKGELTRSDLPPVFNVLSTFEDFYTLGIILGITYGDIEEVESQTKDPVGCMSYVLQAALSRKYRKKRRKEGKPPLTLEGLAGHIAAHGNQVMARKLLESFSLAGPVPPLEPFTSTTQIMPDRTLFHSLGKTVSANLQSHGKKAKAELYRKISKALEVTESRVSATEADAWAQKDDFGINFCKLWRYAVPGLSWDKWCEALRTAGLQVPNGMPTLHEYSEGSREGLTLSNLMAHIAAEMPSKYDRLAIELGFEISSIEKTRVEFSKPQDRLKQILSCYLNTLHASWENLLAALVRMEETTLACDIAQQRGQPEPKALFGGGE